MRDLKADLKSIQEGRILFDDPDPSVGTKYELYEVAEHAIERALELEEELTRCGNTLVELTIALKDDRKRADKAEALARELVEALEIAYDAMYLDITNAPDYPNCEDKVKQTLTKSKEVLGDE